MCVGVWIRENNSLQLVVWVYDLCVHAVLDDVRGDLGITRLRHLVQEPEMPMSSPTSRGHLRSVYHDYSISNRRKTAGTLLSFSSSHSETFKSASKLRFGCLSMVYSQRRNTAQRNPWSHRRKYRYPCDRWMEETTWMCERENKYAITISPLWDQ